MITGAFRWFYAIIPRYILCDADRCHCLRRRSPSRFRRSRVNGSPSHPVRCDPAARRRIGASLTIWIADHCDPDGYTLLMVLSGNAINPAIYENLSFNFIRDIAPVASIARASLVMEVHASFP